MKKKKPGFTLMEMIIVLALIVVIVTITSSMFITGNKVFYDSDVKSTLQMEARDIQEELTDLGMQGIGVTDIEINNSNKNSEDNKLYVDMRSSDLEDKTINKLQISGYDKDSEYSKDEDGTDRISNPQTYTITFTDSTLSVGDRDLSTHVTRFKIIPEDGEGSFSSTSTIEFDIVLSKGKVNYPINFKITFRNRNK
ncbi:MAG: prepilin-type N-terminal cleavage/methylation domain-containing protein [Clostridium beijerinckii]